MPAQPIAPFLDQLRNRLTLEKKWIGLEPHSPIQFARLRYRYFDEAPDVVTVVDAQNSSETPTAIFQSLKNWFDVAIPRHGRGVLILVYSSVSREIDAHIRNASWGRVERSWYDLSKSEHFLSAGDLEGDIFG